MQIVFDNIIREHIYAQPTILLFSKNESANIQ
jgi:hypothetical protein